MADPRVRLLEDGIGRLGLELGSDVRARLLAYLDELVAWNRAYNLTAVRDPMAMVVRHLLDSLAVLPHIDGQGPLLDVGAGAGLPGLVLAIARPGLAVTTLDSNGKKVRFMRHAVRTLDLADVQVAEARVERWDPPQPFAQIVSRAFASLTDFVESTRHLLAPDGTWLAMKGQLDPAEQAALPSFAAISSITALSVPGLDEARHLIRLRDTESTRIGS